MTAVPVGGKKRKNQSVCEAPQDLKKSRPLPQTIVTTACTTNYKTRWIALAGSFRRISHVKH